MASLPRIRRRDRAVEDEAWVADYLGRAPWGVLALVEEGRPHVNMNLFAYDREARALYVHTARHGHTRTLAEEAPRVPASFAVGEMGRLLPASRALEFSVEYASVVAHGPFEVVRDAEEQRRAMSLLLRKYAPHLRAGEHFEDSTAADLARTSVYRLSVEAWTAKRKRAPPDQPGAYVYGDLDAPRGPFPDET